MKLRSPWVGSAKGKLGDGVYYRRKGVQCARARAIEIANPQSEQQMVTRAAFATATKLAASINADIVSHSFEGLQYGEKSRNYFIGMATKLFRQRTNEAIGGDFNAYAPIVGKMARFGNIADGLRISQGSLPSHSVAIFNPEEDGSAGNVVRIGFAQPLASASAMATATIAQFESIFGVSRDGQVTVVIFENIVESESASMPLNCAVPRIFRFSLLATAEDSAQLFVAADDVLTLNTAVLDMERTSADIADLHFVSASPNSFSIGLGDAVPSDPDSQTNDVVELSPDTQGVGFAIITSKWVDGKWLRSTETIHGADSATASALYMENATSWNHVDVALGSYTKSGASETNDRYLNKEKN